MTAKEIAEKYVYMNHNAPTDSQEVKDMVADIEEYASSKTTLDAPKSTTKLTRETLIKLGFWSRRDKYTLWMIDIYEQEEGVFSVDLGRTYINIDTVEELYDYWKATKAEKEIPLPIHLLNN